MFFSIQSSFFNLYLFWFNATSKTKTSDISTSQRKYLSLQSEKLKLLSFSFFLFIQLKLSDSNRRIEKEELNSIVKKKDCLDEIRERNFQKKGRNDPFPEEKTNREEWSQTKNKGYTK